MPDPDPNLPDAPVLILAPTGNDAANAAAVLARARIETECCQDIESFCRVANEKTGVLLVTEETLDTVALGYLREFLKNQPPWSDIPVILLTKDGEIRQKVYDILNYLRPHGNVSLLERPLRAITFISVLKSALRSRGHQYEVRDLLESYSLAVEGAQLGSWDLDWETGVSRRSLKHDQIFGYASAQPDWSFKTFLQHVVPEDRSRVKNAFGTALVGESLLLDCRIQWPDKSIHWVAIRGRVYSNGEARPTRIAGVVTDITQRKQEEELLRQARHQLEQTAEDLELRVQQRTAQLEETVSEMEAFSYSVSHDLRAPLRAMQGYSQILLEQYSAILDAEGQNYLAKISQASERLDRLTQDLLTYSRVVRAAITMEPVNLDQLISDVIQQYPHFQAPHADITIEKPLLSVTAHETSLIQCTSNLLGNAIKFVPRGVKPSIRIWTERIDDQVRLNFEDNGIGIAPDQIHRIFKMFERVNKQYEGTGIGLAIVRKAAERMGGSVGVKSVLGKGSTFWLQLPAKIL